MVDFQFLYKGLCGLARAHQASGLAGHLGAAVVAGYFFGEEHADLDSRVYAGVEKQLDDIIRGKESIWYDQKKKGITVPALFEPFPKEKPDEKRIPTIAQALAGNINKTRQSGHNVIFASIAIRALHDHPEYATPSIIDGIRKLIAGFNGVVPGRGYWGKEKGWIIGDKVQLTADTEFPAYDSFEQMANAVADDLILRGSQHRRGFGGTVHVTNHAAAITELSEYGFQDLALRALPAHHHHVRLWRSLPDLSEELGALKKAKFDPRTPDYWTDNSPSQASASLSHRIKTLYGFFTLLPFVKDDAKRKKAEEQFLYMMA
ncbi:MAG: hypothetical protein QGG36_16955 [Pirellulaceae bacterium]|jgi:hypothetical protein|nr:hypothetical protein [Pirellulaceae bacterium]MDP7017497.1 hypothetical protein [Pirellulaceae bacterium]